MSSVVDFLAEVNACGVRVWVEDDRLKVRAEKDALTPDLVTRLKSRKPEILNFLRQASRDEAKGGGSGSGGMSEGPPPADDIPF